MPKTLEQRLEIFSRPEEPEHVTIYADGQAIEFLNRGGGVHQMDHPRQLPQFLVEGARQMAEKHFADQAKELESGE